MKFQGKLYLHKNSFTEYFTILDKKSGAKRPRETTENSPVAVKIKSKTQEKTSGTTRLSSISRYIFNLSEVDIKIPYNITSCHSWQKHCYVSSDDKRLTNSSGKLISVWWSVDWGSITSIMTCCL